MIETKAPVGARAIPLARYLARAYPLIPGWVIRNALKNRDVRVNGARVADASISAGDEITAFIPDKYLDFSLGVIYRKDGLLVIDKPPGLPVDLDADGIGEDTVLTRARLISPEARLCHRLDAGTGGVLILATDDSAYENALKAFREHALEKLYDCVIEGVMNPEKGEITDYLIKDGKASFVRVCSGPRPGAEKALLSYRTLERTEITSLARVNLATGKTHQIRAQFAHAGHPLIGDDKYGNRELNKRLKTQRPLLWCKEIVYNGLRFTSLGGVKCI